MKQPIFAGDRPVIAVLRDKTTGAVVSETPIGAHSSMTFEIEPDGNLILEGVDWDGSIEALRARQQAREAEIEVLAAASATAGQQEEIA
ncbi:hypothetical protein DBR17_17855 [Sphingomonas sp. HMWF008]|nr:hypothetical protein DBR17_17855 [Sphingomonas sp. HMWF008]